MALSKLVLVETTVDARTAPRLVRSILRERLAACANAVPVRSDYWWKGRIERAREVLVSFKTTRAQASRLAKRLGELHSYEVPYIAVMPVGIRGTAYARWVDSSVAAR